MPTWQRYRRTNVAEMRPYVPGEDLSNISISAPDRVLFMNDLMKFERGMIARNPKNPDDQWYVAADYFDENFELMDFETVR